MRKFLFLLLSIFIAFSLAACSQLVDFAKNIRFAYRAILEQNKGSFNIGIRFVLNVNAATRKGNVKCTGIQCKGNFKNSKMFIAYLSWRVILEVLSKKFIVKQVQKMFEITIVNPYLSDYSTVLDEAQSDQNAQARPVLASYVDNMDEYDIVITGYPNWWSPSLCQLHRFLKNMILLAKQSFSYVLTAEVDLDRV